MIIVCIQQTERRYNVVLLYSTFNANVICWCNIKITCQLLKKRYFSFMQFLCFLFHSDTTNKSMDNSIKYIAKQDDYTEK
jgi:hypothetical protein